LGDRHPQKNDLPGVIRKGGNAEKNIEKSESETAEKVLYPDSPPLNVGKGVFLPSQGTNFKKNNLKKLFRKKRHGPVLKQFLNPYMGVSDLGLQASWLFRKLRFHSWFKKNPVGGGPDLGEGNPQDKGTGSGEGSRGGPRPEVHLRKTK